MNDFLTVKECAESEYSEKKSVFLGHLSPVKSEEEAKDFILKMKKKYADARHNVWAYTLPDGTLRSSDDGEPAGTGGAPVLDAMVKRRVTGCVIVVTRYFGGILLGTGGLVHAYSTAASDALSSAGSIKMMLYRRISFTASYALYGGASRLLDKYKCRSTETEFSENVQVKTYIAPAVFDSFRREITDLSGGGIIVTTDGEAMFEA